MLSIFYTFPISSLLWRKHAVEETAHDRLVHIFHKIKDGIGLDENDLGFLDTSSRLSITERISSFLHPSPSAQAIGALSAQILNKKLSSAEVLSEVENTLSSHQAPSAQETASLAELLNSYRTREDSFEERLARFSAKKGRDPKREELIVLVRDYNREVLPKISQAGSGIAQVTALDLDGEEERSYQVRYTKEGYLEIIDGAIAPLDLSYTQVLTATQKEQMIELYKKFAYAPYNNLGEFLEFAKYLRESNLTAQSAFDSYQPDLVDIYDKYQSGRCLLLSTKICDEFAKMGIKAQHMSTATLNNWTTLPIPGTEDSGVKWKELSKSLRGADHLGVVCLYLDENGCEQMLKFECSFQKDNPQEICEFSGIDDYLSHFMIDVPNRVIDLQSIAKAGLKGRFKVVYMKDNNKILGIDFLRDNIYINQSWAKSLTGLPLNAKGMISIDLEALVNPDQKGIYFIDGARVELSHREALKLILDKVRSELVIPDDAEENFITLAQHRVEFFDHFFLDPLPQIKTNYDDLLAISKKIKALKDNEKCYPEYRRLEVDFDKVIEPFFMEKGREELSVNLTKLRLRAENL